MIDFQVLIYFKLGAIIMVNVNIVKYKDMYKYTIHFTYCNVYTNI